MADAAQPPRELIRLISHDLRSPLTAMQLNAQLIEQSALRDGREKEQRWASLIAAATRRLDGMLRQLGEAELIRSGQIPLAIEPLVFDQFLRQLLDGGGADIARERVHLTPAKATLALSADRTRLGQAMLNVLHLALQQAAAPARVTVDARARDGEIACTVTAPVPPELAAETAEGRAATPAGRAGGCEGIALHVARTLIECHGGKLRVAEDADRALVFEIALPTVRK
jgi:K+-sensing histidine kinase KdpD